MEALLSPARLQREIEALTVGAHLARPADLVARGLSLFRPPERISTVECAEKYRRIPTPKGDATRPWSRDLTPYLVGPMDALDEAAVQEVIIPKPGRTGGTVAIENYLFKLMRFGPMGDVGWFLKSDSEVKAYANKGLKELFELHPEIQQKVGTGRSDNTLEHKVVDGRSVDLLPANPTKFTNRQFYLMVGDEIDTYTPRICASFVDQTRIRGRALGSDRKVAMASHPDRGWTTGIAHAWVETSRGIYVWPCSECGGWSSPCPTKYWPEVKRMALTYDEAAPDADRDEAIRTAQRTAGLACPHCGTVITDDAKRHAMIDLGQWMHRGQWLDVELGICGEREPNPAMGFWIHGTMSKMITNAEMARDLESARQAFRRTKKTDRLREVTAKVMGEVFEGTGAAGGVDGAELHRRRDKAAFPMGEAPAEALFVTQSVDVGHGKFDIGLWGWDIEGRSWMIDRQTLRQRRHEDGIVRDLRPAERIDDWHVLDEFIDRRVPLAGSGGKVLPVALTLIDSGDGNVTWKAYEYARRMASRRWGDFSAVRVIKGSDSPKAPEVPAGGTPIAKDQNGRAVAPVIRLYNLGVYRLKEQAVERLGVTDGGPGQCYHAAGISQKHLDEFFGERLVGGQWERSGDNESLDLFGYAEAARLMLQPDRRDIKWENPDRRPPWARPFFLEPKGGDQAAPAGGAGEADAAPKSRMARFDALNRRTKPNG